MPAPRASVPVIRNAIQAAQECGVEVGVIEVTKDGTVRVLARDDSQRLPSPDSPPVWGQTG